MRKKLIDGKEITEEKENAMKNNYNEEVYKFIEEKERHVSFCKSVIESLDYSIAELKSQSLALEKELSNPSGNRTIEEITASIKEIEKDILHRYREKETYMKMMSCAEKDASEAKKRIGDDSIAVALERVEIKDQEILDIEGKIAYSFKDKTLLAQAFTRKSFANEHHGLHNEVLEFYGDAIVGMSVTKYMFGRYSNYKVGQAYISTRTEGELSNTRQKRVSSTFLASRIRALGIEKYLLMGKGDIKLAIEDVESVLEDLFESIVGAVFVDNNGDLNKSVEFATSLLSLEEDGASIEDVEHRLSLLFNSNVYIDTDIIHDDSVTLRAYGRGFNSFKTSIEVKGSSLSNALDEMNNIINRIEKNKLCDYVNTLIPTRERAINIIQEMEQKGIISNVKYEFEEEEKDSVIGWNCFASANSPFDSERYYCSDSPDHERFENKKEAKKDAALILLADVLFQHCLFELVTYGKSGRKDDDVSKLIEKEGVKSSYEHVAMKYMEENGLTLVDILKMLQ